MLKIGLSTGLLLMLSGCAGFIGDDPYAQDIIQESNYEQSKNDQLKAEAAALREDIRQQKQQLDSMQ